MNQPYYMAYEDRYRRVFEAGIELWGHSPDDEILVRTLTEWVEKNDLAGKTVAEFACGEGAAGVILSKLGVRYRGFDIAPSAVKKAGERLRDFPYARVEQLDMVKETAGLPETFDAALDCMGFHMLLTDTDRDAYLKNVHDVLKPGAPMLFFRESYRENAYTGVVESFEHWKEITGDDYTTPQLRTNPDGKEIRIPCVPARARNREGYTTELERAGFAVENFTGMDQSSAIQYSVSIYARKR
ncbi:MAG: class I SAM-dependent methyltransferase [Clostridia bacterium]|nr:class I SAM-dependent methyltransferase [Clostridia bacterium]